MAFLPFLVCLHCWMWPHNPHSLKCHLKPNCTCRRAFDSLCKGMGMDIIHVVDHAHEYIMSFQVFLWKSNVHHLEVPFGSLPLCLLNILECCLECSCLLNWRISVCTLFWVEFVVYCMVWWGLDQMKHAPCWKHGEFLESFLMEWVSQWYLNHFCSLHQLMIVAGQKLHLMQLQNVQIVFHWIADRVFGWKVSRRMWCRHIL